MMRSVLDCAKYSDNPLNQMILSMAAASGKKDNQWKDLPLTESDVCEIEKFLSIMGMGSVIHFRVRDQIYLLHLQGCEPPYLRHHPDLLDLPSYGRAVLIRDRT